MTSFGPHYKDYERRKLLTKTLCVPKSLHEVLSSLKKVQLELTINSVERERTLKVMCKRLANRMHVIGQSVFKFDVDGICIVDLTRSPNAEAEYNALLRMNGVKKVLKKVEKVVSYENKVLDKCENNVIEKKVEKSRRGRKILKEDISYGN